MRQAKQRALQQGCSLKPWVADSIRQGLQGGPTTATPAIVQAYGSEALTNLDALAALQAFQALPQVELIEEPVGVERLWWQLAGLGKAAPKRWIDAYLVAFAITCSTRLTSLDQDFRQFLSVGLDLVLLECPE